MTDEMPWVERAEKLVNYHDEALEFVRRASEQLPAYPEDAHTVSRLWVESERFDSLICGLLEEMNGSLLSGAAEMDTTRGASMKPGIMDEQHLAYECTWSLVWNQEYGIFVNLTIDSRYREFNMDVSSLRSQSSQPVRFPVNENELKDALVDAYVMEATVDRHDSVSFESSQE